MNMRSPKEKLSRNIPSTCKHLKCDRQGFLHLDQINPILMFQISLSVFFYNKIAKLFFYPFLITMMTALIQNFEGPSFSKKKKNEIS